MEFYLLYYVYERRRLLSNFHLQALYGSNTEYTGQCPAGGGGREGDGLAWELLLKVNRWGLEPKKDQSVPHSAWRLSALCALL